MSAYVNGAIAALDKILKLLDILDPKKEDDFSNVLRDQIAAYKELYKEMDSKPYIVDETWKNIEDTSNSDQEISDKIKTIFEA